MSLYFREHLADADEKEILYILSLINQNSPEKIEKFNEKIQAQFDPTNPKKLLRLAMNYTTEDLITNTFGRNIPDITAAFKRYFRKQKVPDEAFIIYFYSKSSSIHPSDCYFRIFKEVIKKNIRL